MSPRIPRLLVLFAALLASALGLTGCKDAAPEPGPANQDAAGKYLFCFWNVENFFDDKLDHRKGPGDREYDPWFANDPDILKLKLAKLTEALLKLKDGKGPDILVIVEVESRRAAELLQEALNAKLADPALHYKHVLMKELSAGRHIAPAILTRLPIDGDRTRLLGKRMRILQGQVTVNGHDLIIIASHWSSRLEKGSEHRREHYADAIYGQVRAICTRDPKADVLVCGDFNDTPEDPSVTEHLHATGDVQAVRKSGDAPTLLNLLAGKDPAGGFGTYFYRRWLIFDQVVVTPGMLGAQGWSCDPATVRVVNTLTRPGDPQGRPWKFGGQGARDRAHERGYSDHFPVTVELKVAPP